MGFLKKRDKRVAARQVVEAQRRAEREAEEKARCVWWWGVGGGGIVCLGWNGLEWV